MGIVPITAELFWGRVSSEFIFNDPFSSPWRQSHFFFYLEIPTDGLSDNEDVCNVTIAVFSCKWTRLIAFSSLLHCARLCHLLKYVPSVQTNKSQLQESLYFIVGANTDFFSTVSGVKTSKRLDFHADNFTLML